MFKVDNKDPRTTSKTFHKFLNTPQTLDQMQQSIK